MTVITPEIATAIRAAIETKCEFHCSQENYTVFIPYRLIRTLIRQGPTVFWDIVCEWRAQYIDAVDFEVVRRRLGAEEQKALFAANDAETEVEEIAVLESITTTWGAIVREAVESVIGTDPLSTEGGLNFSDWPQNGLYAGEAFARWNATAPARETWESFVTTEEFAMAIEDGPELPYEDIVAMVEGRAKWMDRKDEPAERSIGDHLKVTSKHAISGERTLHDLIVLHSEKVLDREGEVVFIGLDEADKRLYVVKIHGEDEAMLSIQGAMSLPEAMAFLRAMVD